MKKQKKVFVNKSKTKRLEVMMLSQMSGDEKSQAGFPGTTHDAVVFSTVFEHTKKGTRIRPETFATETDAQTRFEATIDEATRLGWLPAVAEG